MSSALASGHNSLPGALRGRCGEWVPCIEVLPGTGKLEILYRGQVMLSKDFTLT